MWPQPMLDVIGIPLVNDPCVRLGLRLTHHDAAYGSLQRQPVDMVLVKRINSAGMPLSAHFKDGMHHLYGLIESLVFIRGQGVWSAFAREGMFFAYTVAHDHDELPVLGDGKTGYVCQLLGEEWLPYLGCDALRRPTLRRAASPFLPRLPDSPPSLMSWATMASKMLSSIIRLPSAEQPEP